MEPAPESRRGLAQVSIAQIFAVSFGAIFWLLLAAVIHPVAYGYLSWLVSVATILSVLCSMGLGKTIDTYFPKEKDPELLGGSVFLVLVLGLGTGAATSLVLGLPVGLLVMGLCMFSIAMHFELAKRRYRGYMWMWVGVRTLSLFLPLLAYWMSGFTDSILVGLAVSYLIFGFYVLRHLRPGLGKVRQKLGFIYGAWGADASGAAVSFLDKILIGSFFGMTLLGYYQFASRIFVLFGVLPQILFFYLLPERSAGGDTRKVERLGAVVSFVIAGSVFFLAPVVIPAAFPGFAEGVVAVQLMGLAIVPAAIVGIKSSKLYSEEHTGTVLGSNLLAIGVGVAGIAVLGKHFGLLGLSASLLLVQVAMLSGLFIIPKLLNWGTAGKLTGGLIAMTVVSVALLGSVDVRAPVIKIQDGRVVGSGVAMGTDISITVDDENVSRAASAVRAAFDEIDRLDRLMSVTDPTSEIYALNHSGTDWVNVSPDVISVLQRARYYSILSGGSFDATVQPLVELWMEKVKASGKEPDPAELQSAMDLVGWENLVIDEDNSRARFLRPGMEVTLGGIAKGYAADRVVDMLRQAGLEQALVSIGRQVKVFGPKTWTIGVQNPRGASELDLLGTLELENASVATSGDYARFFFLGGKRVHHIIDPRTGRSADNCISATVIVENGIDADALSKIAFVAGLVRGKELLDSLGLKGLIVAADGEIVTTDAWDFPLSVVQVTP